MGLICKWFGHKYIKQNIDMYCYAFICKRCGKNRDVYKKGEEKEATIKYFCRADGKKDE